MPTGKPQRNTKQRAVILEELRAVTSHPSAAELYEWVRQRMPRISLGTVYRNLELLAENGQIRKLDLAGGEARFDGNASPHYHLRCTACDCVVDVHDMPEEPIEKDIQNLNGFRVLGYNLEFYGICPECLAPQSLSGCQPTDAEPGRDAS